MGAMVDRAQAVVDTWRRTDRRHAREADCHVIQVRTTDGRSATVRSLGAQP